MRVMSSRDASSPRARSMADSQLRGRVRPRIGKRSLPGWEIFLATRPGADERWQHKLSAGRHARFVWRDRIHQAKTNRLHEFTRLFDGAHGAPVQTPLVAAKLAEFVLSHGDL